MADQLTLFRMLGIGAKKNHVDILSGSLISTSNIFVLHSNCTFHFAELRTYSSVDFFEQGWWYAQVSCFHMKLEQFTIEFTVPPFASCFGTFCSFRIDVRFGWYNSLLLSKWGWKLPLWRCFPMEVTTRSVIVLVPTNESSHMIIFKGILQLPSRIFPPLPCSCQRSYPHDPWFPCISLRPFPFALGRWAACESGHWGSWWLGCYWIEYLGEITGESYLRGS